MAIPPPSSNTFSIDDAWKPLQSASWDSDAVSHLLRRIGFSATPEAVQSAQDQGLQTTVVPSRQINSGNVEQDSNM